MQDVAAIGVASELVSTIREQSITANCNGGVPAAANGYGVGVDASPNDTTSDKIEDSKASKPIPAAPIAGTSYCLLVVSWLRECNLAE